MVRRVESLVDVSGLGMGGICGNYVPEMLEREIHRSYVKKIAESEASLRQGGKSPKSGVGGGGGSRHNVVVATERPGVR